MAIAKQSVDIGILLQSTDYPSNSVEYTLTVQNESIEIVPEYWGGGAFDETIGAKRISNLRGYRVKLSLDYNASREATERTVSAGTATDSTFRRMYNDILYCFVNNEIPDNSNTFVGLNLRIKTSSGENVITESNTSSTFLNFIPEDMSYTQRYTNQIGRFIPRMSFVSEKLLPSIPAELEGVV